MLYYIRKYLDNKLYILEDNYLKIQDKTFTKIVNAYLNNYLTDLKSREINMKKKFKFKAKIPIYIDDQNLLMCIYSHRTNYTYYINYFSVRSYDIFSRYIVIHFNNSSDLKLSQKNIFFNQARKCEIIINFLKSKKL